MPASDFFEFMVFERLEPFGDLRGDLQAGIIAATLANINRGKNTKPFKAADFMPNWNQPVEQIKQQTPEQVLAIMKILQTVQASKIAANG